MYQGKTLDCNFFFLWWFTDEPSQNNNIKQGWSFQREQKVKKKGSFTIKTGEHQRENKLSRRAPLRQKSRLNKISSFYSSENVIFQGSLWNIYSKLD